MKDYYDLHQILSANQYNAEILRIAIKRTFDNRHTEYKEDVMFFRKEYLENAAMQIRWKAFIRKITSKSNLSFSDVVRYLQTTLKPYWENLKHE